jgi:hypothetical protein
MKSAIMFVLILAASSLAFAQDTRKGNEALQSGGSVGFAVAARMSGAPVQGAPYSATVTNESVQTLSDDNHIVQRTTGNIARDSQGRTRQDTPVPAIGNISGANGPHFVIIMDPVAQVSYTLDVTNETAQKMPMPAGVPGGGGGQVFFQRFDGPVTTGSAPALPPAIAMMKPLGREDDARVSSEELGTQMMEGLLVTGVRTTRTIPAGEIGNEKPLSVVTEVWTSPDLKTIIYSKRTDPRMGEQTFKLTNIQRTEPDGSLFTVPANFKLADGPQNFIYRTNP